jgi:uncharacterized protein YjiS (DUF1127 family)
MLWINLLGYAASASVLVTFCMNTMVPLRAVAICSNVLFGVFGAMAHIYPVLILHVILLPVNIVRLVQVVVIAQEPTTIAVASIMLASLQAVIRPTEAKSKVLLPRFKIWVAEWRRRARERRELINLSERERHDVLITRCDAQAEAFKPFWRA